MMNIPILSIVIPTKNRYKYLKNFVSRVLLFDRHDFEVVIQDNSDTNHEIIQFIDSYKKDPRVRYHYSDWKLDVCANSDLAVSNATGKYICFIGDDDGITEECIDICYWMDENNVDSANCCIAIYDWPDLYKKYYGYTTSGEVRHVNFTSQIFEVNPRTELIAILENGAQIVSHGARLYQGIVKKECLDKLKDFSGSYFPGPVPDMSSAVGIVPFINKHIYVDYPLIIVGSSGRSTAGLGAQKKHQGEINDIPHLPACTAENWSREVPFYWSGPTIWAEGAIQALKNTGNGDLIRHFNFNNLLALCLVYDNKFRVRTIRHIMSRLRRKEISVLAIIYYMIRILFRRIVTLVNNVLINKYFKHSRTSNIVIHKADSISQVMDYFSTKRKTIFYSKGNLG